MKKQDQVSEFLDWIAVQSGYDSDREFSHHLSNILIYGREAADDMRRDRAIELIEDSLYPQPR